MQEHARHTDDMGILALVERDMMGILVLVEEDTPSVATRTALQAAAVGNCCTPVEHTTMVLGLAGMDVDAVYTETVLDSRCAVVAAPVESGFLHFLVVGLATRVAVHLQLDCRSGLSWFVWLTGTGWPCHRVVFSFVISCTCCKDRDIFGGHRTRWPKSVS
jgi:hypothetical protein